MPPNLPIPNLFARRSIRQYAPGEVTDAQITTLLKAAMAAANAGNRQPWHYIVVREAAMRKRIAEKHPYAGMAAQAAVVIIPCGEPGASFPNMNDFWIQDLAASTQNLLLAATGLGLGAVWCGVHPNAERVQAIRELLGIPEHIVPFCVVCIGQPGEQKEPRTQYNAGRIHQERW